MHSRIFLLVINSASSGGFIWFKPVSGTFITLPIKAICDCINLVWLISYCRVNLEAIQLYAVYVIIFSYININSLSRNKNFFYMLLEGFLLHLGYMVIPSCKSIQEIVSLTILTLTVGRRQEKQSSKMGSR